MTFTVSPMFPGDFYEAAERFAKGIEAAASNQNDTWRQMTELGWQGVLVREDDGGIGGTLTDVAAIVEATGRHAVALPVIARCVLAPMLLTAAARNPAARQLLGHLVTGEASFTPVFSDAAIIVAGAVNGKLALSGMLRGVDASAPATHYIFQAWRPEDARTPLLVLLPAADLADNAPRYLGVDGRVSADIRLDGVMLDAAHVLLEGEAAKRAMQDAAAAGALMTCVQTIGAIGALIEQTIDYLLARFQFGVALASFQALRHDVVEMYVAYENAYGLTRKLVLHHSAGASNSQRTISLAKLYLSSIGRDIAEAAIQLHGGMGMTRELPAARLATYTLMSSLQFGDRYQQLACLTEAA